VRCTVRPDGVAIEFGPREGRFAPWWSQVAVTVHGWQGKADVRAGERKVASRVDAAARTVAFKMDDAGQGATVVVRKQ
jgi:alpha-glucosidase